MKTIIFQTIKFSINTQFTLIWPIDRALSGATTLGQCGPGSDGNKGVLHITQSSSITGTSPSDCLMSYPGYPLWEGILPFSRGAVGVFYSLSRLDIYIYIYIYIYISVCVCVYMCVCERERERERVCVCACVCVWERERESVCVCVCVC